jgi:DNA-binding transcriptional ArsR family regulator
VSPPSSQATRIFGALADPTRFGIVQRLRSGELRVAELCRDTGCAQSLISFHLKALRDAGLIRSRKDGRSIWYSIEPAGLSTIVRLVESLGGSPDEGTAAARVADLELCLKYINHR